MGGLGECGEVVGGLPVETSLDWGASNPQKPRGTPLRAALKAVPPHAAIPWTIRTHIQDVYRLCVALVRGWDTGVLAGCQDGL